MQVGKIGPLDSLDNEAVELERGKLVQYEIPFLTDKQNHAFAIDNIEYLSLCFFFRILKKKRTARFRIAALCKQL